MIFKTCIGFVHQKEDAEDLTQEVFIQTFLALKNFQQKSSFSTWLTRIAINTCLNFIRKKHMNFMAFWKNSKQFTNEELVKKKQLTDYTNSENRLIQHEQQTILQKALDSLPKNQRIAIILSKYNDLSQKEIAQILNTTEGTVEALIQRGKANLRKKIKRYI